MTRQEAFTMLDQMAKGIAEMFGSNCETVIHDLADPLHPVLAIYNGHVSGRSVGSTRDVTGVEQDLYLDNDVVNLLAVTPSGQQTKSSTFSIKGEDYHLGFGINYDFTPLAYANRVLLDLMHTEVDFHSAVYKPRDNGISELFDSALLRVGKPAREMNKADLLPPGRALCGRPSWRVPLYHLQVPGRGQRNPRGGGHLTCTSKPFNTTSQTRNRCWWRPSPGWFELTAP